MNRKLTSSLTLAAAALLASAPVLADYDREDDDRRYGRAEYAKVVRATPIYRQVRIDSPRQECREQRIVHRDPGYQDGGVLVGAILGGVAGHQFGKGRSNAAATAAGALIGASIAQNRHGALRERVSYEPVCTTYNEYRYEERVEGYDVAYKYHGRVYHTRMPYDPGSRIRVNVDVSPVHSY
jgi:uncharacterized protein YcfJ